MENKSTRILIGIQARSTSTRLPNKGLALIGQKTMTQHVIDACNEASGFIQKGVNSGHSVECFVSLVVPEGDPLAKEYEGKTPVFQGSEHDVLGRYGVAMKQIKPDFLVRITGDCPLIPPYVITTHVKKAIIGDLDYCSNVNEFWRTDLDGWDCEVLSLRLFQYAFDNARAKEDREHVTVYLRKHPPRWARIASVIGFVDISDTKLSVDTPEDLERVRKQYDLIQKKISLAKTNNHLVFRL